MIQTIYTTIKALKTKTIITDLDISHVKGRQDDDTDYKNLSIQAKINVQADQQANQFMQHTTIKYNGALILPEKIQIRINSKEIT